MTTVTWGQGPNLNLADQMGKGLGRIEARLERAEGLSAPAELPTQGEAWSAPPAPKKLVAYVAGPYRAPHASGILANIQAAREVAVELWRMGFAVICPHSNTALFDGLAPDDVWLEGDLELLRRSDVVVLLPRWRASEGAFLERAEALARGIPVYEWAQRFDRGTLVQMALACKGQAASRSGAQS